MAGPGSAETVVVDTSVVVKWWHEEEHRAAAIALRDAHVARRIRLAAPSLLPYEVANALKYGGVAGERDVAEALEDLEAFQLATAEFAGPVRGRAVRLAFRTGITVYDAAFYALAESLQCRIVTADEPAMKRARYGRAVHIRDYLSG